MRLFTLVRTLVYMTAFFFLWGYASLAVKRYDARLGGELPADARVIGVMLFALGIALAVSCGLAFTFYGRGTPAPFDAPREFVAAGPYRWVRNPMYIGGLAALVGFALWERSPSIALLAVALSIALHLLVVFYEEPTLREQFGDSYLAYKARVNRWLPRRTTRGGTR